MYEANLNWLQYITYLNYLHSITQFTKYVIHVLRAKITYLLDYQLFKKSNKMLLLTKIPGTLLQISKS